MICRDCLSDLLRKFQTIFAHLGFVVALGTRCVGLFFECFTIRVFREMVELVVCARRLAFVGPVSSFWDHQRKGLKLFFLLGVASRVTDRVWHSSLSSSVNCCNKFCNESQPASTFAMFACPQRRWARGCPIDAQMPLRLGSITVAFPRSRSRKTPFLHTTLPRKIPLENHPPASSRWRRLRRLSPFLGFDSSNR